MSRKREREDTQEPSPDAVTALLRIIQVGDSCAVRQLIQQDEKLLASKHEMQDALLYALAQTPPTKSVLSVLFEECFLKEQQQLEMMLEIVELAQPSDWLHVESFFPRAFTFEALVAVAVCSHDNVRLWYCQLWNLKHFAKYRSKLQHLKILTMHVKDVAVMKKPFNEVASKVIQLFGEAAECGEFPLVQLLAHMHTIYFGRNLLIDAWPMQGEEEYQSMPLFIAVCSGQLECVEYLTKHLPVYKGEQVDIMDIEVNKRSLLQHTCDRRQQRVAVWLANHYPELLASISNIYYDVNIFCAIYDKVVLNEIQFKHALKEICRFAVSIEQLEWLFDPAHHTLHTPISGCGLAYFVLQHAILCNNVEICHYILSRKILCTDRNTLIARTLEKPNNTADFAIMQCHIVDENLKPMASYPSAHVNLLELVVYSENTTQQIREMIFSLMSPFVLQYEWSIEHLSRNETHVSFAQILDLLLKHNVLFRFDSAYNLKSHVIPMITLVWQKHFMVRLRSALKKHLNQTIIDEVAELLAWNSNSCVESITMQAEE
jgi:hypothetical protein